VPFDGEVPCSQLAQRGHRQTANETTSDTNLIAGPKICICPSNPSPSLPITLHVTFSS